MVYCRCGSFCVFVLAGILVQACNKVELPSSANDASDVYFTSFESTADTSGWIGGMSIESDAPVNGGARSVMISGGCIHPHAARVVEGPSNGGYLSLQCWGKNLAIGGGIVLYRRVDPSRRIEVSVTDTVWSFIQSDETLFCPAGEQLVLEMSSGGIVYSAMLIDLLTVKKTGDN